MGPTPGTLIVIALHVHDDLAWSEAVVLPQVDDLLDKVGSSGAGWSAAFATVRGRNQQVSGETASASWVRKDLM